jgi:hypothetical protein
MRARTRVTSLERYGVESAAHAPEVEARRAATNQSRYGAANPFCKESVVFDKVQASLEGRRPILRGAGNPFARPEVKEKIRKHWLQEHGVENPQQVPEIRAQTRETNQERYGGELRGSPVLRIRIDQTNVERYGSTEPSRDPGVKARIQETNLTRYGVPWTGMDPEVRRKQLEAHHERYGSHFFASEEGREAIRRAFLDRYGVDHWMKTPGAWDRLVTTFREKFGVDHPLQIEAFREKQRDTNIKRYGTPFPGLRLKEMNYLEARLYALAPPESLLFTGDGKFWRWLPKLGHHKNPDFIVPGPDPKHPKRGVTRIVEAFGDFWHSRMFTGRAPFDHEQDLIDAYAEVGIACLVVWEFEVKSDPDGVKERLAGFLAKALTP